MHDVIIAGGGLAGLSAALILGRCRRDVVVYDSGRPRNCVSRGLHGFITRDGINPHEIRSLARNELERYPSITCIDGEVVDAHEVQGGYEIELRDGRRDLARYLLIATGVVDKLPQIEGVQELYGQNVFHCPYCDGWEMRDQPLAVYGSGDTGYEYALELLGWSKDVILCTDGGERPAPQQMEHLAQHGIRVITERIVALEGSVGDEVVIRFDGREVLTRRGLFFNPEQWQASPLAAKLGCDITGGGVVKAGKLQQAKERLFVAGDAARSVQLGIIAAAEGAEAAYAINTALQKEDTAMR